jgi:pyruvate dehydrogenase E1 component alpha subunit
MGNTPVKIIHPKDDFADLGFNYGVPAKVVDGQDVFAVHKEVQTAIDRARADEGPSLIECKTYRIQPHAVGLPDTLLGRPRTQEEIEVWRKRDPIKLAQKRLLKEGVLTQVDIEKIDGGAANEMEEADRLAWADPMPTDPKEILKKALYAE